MDARKSVVPPPAAAVLATPAPAVLATPDDVFRDFRGRRTGLIKALTTDVKKFCRACDQGKDYLCLYGLPNGTWEVNLPLDDVPPEIPDPVLGINFARRGRTEEDWLSLVARHSDSWLVSVAFFFGARFEFDKESRERLFGMINSLPTIHEIVTGTSKRESKEYTLNSSSKSDKSGSKPSHQLEPNSNGSKMQPPKDEEGERENLKEDQESSVCGVCFKNGGEGLFWILCDICEIWYHGLCVNVSPPVAELIHLYKCPSCILVAQAARDPNLSL